MREEGTHREPVHLLPAPLALAKVGPEKAGKLGEVPRVRLDGIGRYVPLLREMFQKRRDEVGGGRAVVWRYQAALVRRVSRGQL